MNNASSYEEQKRSEEELEQLRKAAESGDLYAIYEYGMELAKRGSSNDVLNWFNSCELVDTAVFCRYLGICYSDGDGVEKNSKLAFQWFLKAAEQGNVDALFDVGLCYLYGDGVEEDEKEAFQWFLKAAEQELVVAQCLVGWGYLGGEGVEKDEKEAFQWFLKAEAAEPEFVEAQYAVGYCYLKGVGVKKDEEKAYHYIFSAAENGSFEAQCLLGFKFNKCIEIDKNNTNALEKIKQQADANNVDAQFALAEMEFWGNDVVKRDRYNAAYWYEKIKGSDSYSEQAKRRLAFMNYFGLGTPKNIDKAKELWQDLGYNWEGDSRPVSLKELLICYVESFGRNTFEEPECKLWDKFYIPLKRLNYSRYSDVSFVKFWKFCDKYHNKEQFPSISIDAFWNILMHYEDARQILQYSKKPAKLLKAVKGGMRDVFEELCEEEDREFLGRVNVFFSIREAFDVKKLEPWSINTSNNNLLSKDSLSFILDSETLKSAANRLNSISNGQFSRNMNFAERVIRRDVASCIEAVDDVSGYYDYETRHNMNDILVSSEFSEVTNYVKRLLDKKEENSTESNKDNEDYTTIIALLHTLLLNKKKEDFDIFSKDIYDIPPLDNQNLNTSKQSEDELKELGGILFRKNYLPKFRKIAEDIKDLSTAYAFMYMLTMSKCFILEKLLTETYKPIVNSINELLRPIKNREIRQKLILKIEKYEEIINTYKCKEEPEKPWKYIQHFAIELFDLMFQSNIVITELEITKDMVKSKSTVERQMFKKFVLENDLTGEFISKYNVKYEIEACIKYWGSGNVQLSKSSFEKVNKLAARYKID